MESQIKEDDEVLQYERTLDKPTNYSTDYKWPILDPELDEEFYAAPKPEPKLEVESKFKVPIDFYYLKNKRPLTVRETLDEASKITDRHEKAVRTRPRIYKCPEVSLDDIPDKKMRDDILKFMYTSETKNVMEESAKAISFDTCKDCDCVNTKLLLDGNERIIKEIKARKFSLGIVDTEGPVMKPTDWQVSTGKEWDHKQQRFMNQSTESFWSKKEKQEPKEITMPPEKNEHVKEMLRKNKVRNPHIYTKYAGFTPTESHRIPLEKHHPNKYDFWFTTNQSYGKHYPLEK